MPPLAGLLPLLAVAGLVIWLLVAGRRGAFQAAGNVIVRCSAGHLFTTTWLPLVSLKAIRLGPIRFQYCPVGRHFTFVTRVPDSDLTDAERLAARRQHDAAVP